MRPQAAVGAGVSTSYAPSPSPSMRAPRVAPGLHWRSPGALHGPGFGPRTAAPEMSMVELAAARQTLAASLASPAADTRDVGLLLAASNLGVPRSAHALQLMESALTPSQGWQPQQHHPSPEQLWNAVRVEAKHDADGEPTLASFLYSTILVHPTFPKSLAFVLANKLASPTLFSTQLVALAEEAYASDPGIIAAAQADLLAVSDRDPACDHYTQCMLYFKGYHAVQSHRIAHYLWKRGRRALALALQSRISEVFHVDIHPAAVLGRGIMLDHATGIVVGETAVVGDNVSMLHHVTLGGSGTGKGIRHPTIGHGVLLGAGVSVLGPITVGCGTKVGAGSVVVSDLPCHSVAVGVPARIIKRNATAEPVLTMDLVDDFVLDYVI